MMKFLKTILIIFVAQTAFSQSVDHWEAAVLASDEWHYRLGFSEPPQGWMNPDFDDSLWAQGEGGIGYGDGDDNTVIDPVISLSMRKEFQITDLSKIADCILYADFDDAFVAYLNGQEIARANIGIVGEIPTYNTPAIDFVEAQLYQGGTPSEFSISMETIEQLLQQGTNTLAIQVHNVGIESSDLSSNFFLALGINDETQDYNPMPAWFLDPFLSSNLPILVVETDENNEIPAEDKIGAHFGIIDNGEGQRNNLNDPFNGYDGRIGIEIRGASSLMFPKKNYGFETRDDLGENNNVSLLGMPIENDWILHGPYSDKSLIRNVLSYHIGQLTGRYTPRTRLCELVINGDYRGVYMLTEKIKRDANRVDVAKLRPEDISDDELTGGYIIKIDRHTNGLDDGWYSNYSSNMFYAYHDPSYDELVTVQKDYIRSYINSFEVNVFQENIEEVYDEYLDIPSFVDYFLATEIFKHIDGWKLSFYMYKKKDSNGGKLHFGPLWDLNLAYGNFDFARDPGPENWTYLWALNNSIRPLWLTQLVDIPAVKNQINCRWRALRESSFRTDSLLQFIADNATDLEEASERNFDRWPTLGTYVWPNSFIGNTYEDEIDFLSNWLEARLEWMDHNMVGVCTTDVGEPIEGIAKVNIYPNPVGSELSINFEKNIEQDATLQVRDVNGKIMSTVTMDQNSHQIKIDVQFLPAAVYQIVFLGQDTSWSQLFIKQ